MGSNANGDDGGLTFRWQFGDGQFSDQSRPLHAYSQPGEYTVTLSVRNTAGQSLSASGQVRAADLALVQGRLCSGGPPAGWCWQRPLPQGELIRGHVFVDALNAYAVGDGGTVLATRDGGITWTARPAGLRQSLLAVVAPGPDVAWVAGTFGLVLRTDDGGAHWSKLTLAENVSVREIGADDAIHGWVIGLDGIARVTRDGGITWTRVLPPGGGGSGARVVVRNAGEQWAVLGQTPAARIWRSRDLGASWIEIALPPMTTSDVRYLEDLKLDAAGNILLIGGQGRADFVGGLRRVALRSVDGGTSWREIDLSGKEMPGTPLNVSVTADGTLYLEAGYGSSIERSTDGGLAWSRVPMPDAANFVPAELRFFSARLLTVRDGYGRILVSNDAGTSWLARSPAAGGVPSLNDLWMFDRRNGLAVGYEGSLRTSDGGQTWVREPGGDGQSFTRVQFTPDGQLGWALTTGANPSMLRSTDRGRTWIAMETPPEFRFIYYTDFQFFDAQRGWAVLRFAGGREAIYLSTNGGLSWQPTAGTAAIDGLQAVRFADAEHGVAIGPPGFALTSSDGGRNWAPRPTGVTAELHGLAFVDSQTVVAVGDGGAILRSTDRGLSWTMPPSPTSRTLRGISFLDSQVGHAVGSGGAILRTSDGGRSWRVLDTGTATGLSASIFVDGRTGWAVGDSGSILVTVTGGE